MSIFEVKDKGLKRLVASMTASPKKFRKASAIVLNSWSYETRNEVIKVLHRKTKTRTKSFAGAMTRFTGTNYATPVGSQKTIVGFIDRVRFSGFVEQEFGKKVESKHHSTLAGRGGSASKKIKRGVRLDRNMDKLSARSKHKAIKFLRGRKSRKPFIIKNQDNIKDGVYVMKKQKLTMMQSFEKQKQPKRFSFLKAGLKNSLRKNTMDSLWRKNMEKILKK